MSVPGLFVLLRVERTAASRVISSLGFGGQQKKMISLLSVLIRLWFTILMLLGFTVLNQLPGDH
jgi:hypothetical protein